jgi:hypothetical protein
MSEFADGLILRVAERAGVRPKTLGKSGEYVIRCPRAGSHRNGDANPSCRLNPEKNVFRCNPCSWGGGLVDLARELGVRMEDVTDAGQPTLRHGRSHRPVTKRALVFESSGPISEKTQQFFAESLGKSYHPHTWKAFGVAEGRVGPEGCSDRWESCIAFPHPAGVGHLYLYRREAKRARWRFAQG